MKLNSIVRTKKTGLALYMYPHERPVEDTTICSILSRRNNHIYHVPFSDIKPYNNTCWRCGHTVNSNQQTTCDICHWVSCPNCGACKQGGCASDGIAILDVLDDKGWIELTGYDKDLFFDDYANDEYCYLGQASTKEVERCYVFLKQNGLQPILIINTYGILSLYIDKAFAQQAKHLIDTTNGRLTYSVIDDIIDGYENTRSRGCCFCGAATYGDTLCPTCANNID